MSDNELSHRAIRCPACSVENDLTLYGVSPGSVIKCSACGAPLGPVDGRPACD